MIKQLEQLELNQSIVIDGKKKDIETATGSMSGKYIVTKISYDKCVVVLVEDAESFTQQLYNSLDQIKPFERKEFTFESIEYARTLVSGYNKNNGRHFRVSTKGGVVTIFESISEITTISDEDIEKWRSGFDAWLNRMIF